MISNRVWFDELAHILLPLSMAVNNALCTSLQTSFITSADTLLISLCCKVTKYTLLQESGNCSLQFNPHTHITGRFYCIQLYLTYRTPKLLIV